MKRLTTFARDVELADEWVNASAAALTVLSAPAAGRWVSKLGIKSGLRLPSGADPTD
jgi:hypothetical protein